MTFSKKILPKVKKKLHSFLTDESWKISKKDALGIAAVWSIISTSTAHWLTWWHGSGAGHFSASPQPTWWTPLGHANAYAVPVCQAHASWGATFYNGHYSHIPSVASWAWYWPWSPGWVWHGSHWSHWSHWSHGSHWSHSNSGTWCSCFLAEATVLMYDGNLKNLWEVKLWDLLMGMDWQANTVIEFQRIKLWENRSMMYFPDKSLYFSSEHSFWVQQDGEEYWGTNDYNYFLYEQRIGWRKKDTFRSRSWKEVIPLSGLTEYAHIEAWWIQQFPHIDRSYDGNTELISIGCDGSHSMIINGYIVEAYVKERNFLYNEFSWDNKKILYSFEK